MQKKKNQFSPKVIESTLKEKICIYIYLGPCLQVLKLLRLYIDPWSKTFVLVGSFLEIFN